MPTRRWPRPGRRCSSMRCWPTAPPRRWSSPPCTRPRSTRCSTAAQRARHAPDRRQGADGPPRARRPARRRGAAPSATAATLIERWHGRGRLAYAVTLRFAPTSTPRAAGDGRRAAAPPTPGLYMQTHVAENRAEVRWVAELFPEARSYLDVYARARPAATRARCWRTASGSTTPTARALRDTGAQIAFCPVVQPVPRQRPVRLAARPRRRRAPSAWPATWAAAPACRCCARWPTPTRCRRWPARASRAWAALHAATRGAAQALRPGPRDRRAGARPHGRPVPVGLGRRPGGARAAMRLARDLHERVFAWMTLADERNLVAHLGRRRARATRGA